MSLERARKPRRVCGGGGGGAFWWVWCEEGFGAEQGGGGNRGAGDGGGGGAKEARVRPHLRPMKQGVKLPPNTLNGPHHGQKGTHISHHRTPHTCHHWCNTAPRDLGAQLHWHAQRRVSNNRALRSDKNGCTQDGVFQVMPYKAGQDEGGGPALSGDADPPPTRPQPGLISSAFSTGGIMTRGGDSPVGKLWMAHGCWFQIRTLPLQLPGCPTALGP